MNIPTENRPEARLMRAAHHLTRVGKTEFTGYELAVQEGKNRLWHPEMRHAALYRALAALHDQDRLTMRKEEPAKVPKGPLRKSFAG